MGKKHPYYGKSMNINFPEFPHTMGFVAFSHSLGNWWENPCISHMMKYTTGWESNGGKAPLPWEKYEYQFPRLSHISWVLLHFPVLWEIDAKIHAFPIWWHWLVGYTPSCLQLLRKLMSLFSLFFLYSSFSYFQKSLTIAFTYFCVIFLQIFIIFLDTTKLKLVWIKMTTFF